MGGKSDDSASREMIDMQKAEAAEARAKEVARKARIEGGLTKIKAAFHGGAPITKAVDKSFKATGPAAGTASGAAVAGLPEGFTYQRQPGTAPAQNRAATQAATDRENARRASARGTSARANVQPTQAVVAPNGEWMIKGPDGKLYKMGSDIGYQDTVTTGKSADPTKSFLADYESNYLGNFLPQVATQFKDARDQTTFDLADAGTLQSSMAGTELAKLIEQNKVNEADVRGKATAAVGDLKGRLADEEAKAQAQLYSTENPETAAANALHAVENITAENAPNTLLGDIFKVATIGGANYLKGGTNKYYRDKYVPGGAGATTVVNA